MSSPIDLVVQTISEKINPIDVKVINNQIEIIIESRQIISSFQFLKDSSKCQFRQLTDIAGVDYPDRENRFEFNRNFQGGVVKEDMYRKLLHLGEQRKKSNAKTKKNRRKRKKKTRKLRIAF